MGGRICCVKNCRRRSHDPRGRKLPNGLTFYCFPAWRTDEGEHTSELTRRRRQAWVEAVGRDSITFDHIPFSMRVCSRHFHSGKPAFEMMESDPDWVPSLQMGRSEGNSRHAERLPVSERAEEEEKKQEKKRTGRPPKGPKAAARGGQRKPAALPWREFKAQLGLVLQRHTNKEKTRPPENATREPPAAVETIELNFRDFFRNSLEASLQASVTSRTLSALRTSREDMLVLNHNRPPVGKTSGRSSSCGNCVRLQSRITQLQKRLRLLSGEQEEVKASPLSLQSPEAVHMMDKELEWMEPLPPQWVLGVGDQNQNTAVPQEKSGPHRFRPAWLKTFSFLRYSESLNLMWCHVCHLHADESLRNTPLVKGSRVFKSDNIRKHSNRMYHKLNLRRHMMQTQQQDGPEGQPEETHDGHTTTGCIRNST